MERSALPVVLGGEGSGIAVAQAQLGTARTEATRAVAPAVVSEHAGQRAPLGEQADELRWSYAGLRVEIPQLIAVLRERARRCVRHQALHLVASGLSDREITRTTGLSRRTVARLRQIRCDLDAIARRGGTALACLLMGLTDCSAQPTNGCRGVTVWFTPLLASFQLLFPTLFGILDPRHQIIAIKNF